VRGCVCPLCASSNASSSPSTCRSPPFRTRIPSWPIPDFVFALSRLRNLGFTIAIISNGMASHALRLAADVEFHFGRDVLGKTSASRNWKRWKRVPVGRQNISKEPLLRIRGSLVLSSLLVALGLVYSLTLIWAQSSLDVAFVCLAITLLGLALFFYLFFTMEFALDSGNILKRSISVGTES